MQRRILRGGGVQERGGCTGIGGSRTSPAKGHAGNEEMRCESGRALIGKTADGLARNDRRRTRRYRARNVGGVNACAGGGVLVPDEEKHVRSGVALRTSGKVHVGTVDGSKGIMKWWWSERHGQVNARGGCIPNGERYFVAGGKRNE